MRSKHIILLLLTLLPIFASALILPSYFTPLRFPLYLVAIAVTLLLMTKHIYRFITFPVWYGAIFLILLLISSLFNSALDAPVTYRQFLVYASLFFCIYIGYLAFRRAVKLGINYPKYLTVIFILLFGYGIYTFYAQKYDLYEFFWFLRPSPAVRFLDAQDIYSQQFFGALNRYRAYSVWYEPSFASLALACALPLLFLCNNKKLIVCFLVTSAGFALLTYSRSAWLVYICFLIIYLWSIFKIRLSVWLLAFILISIIPLSFFAGFLSVSGNPDVSALIRFYNSIQAIAELFYSPWGMVVGLGSPDLAYPPMFGRTASANVTNGFIAMLHWLGTLGLMFFLMPFIILLNKAKNCEAPIYWAVLAFVFLTCIALNLGGGFFGLSLLWFFYGIYYAISEHFAKVKQSCL